MVGHIIQLVYDYNGAVESGLAITAGQYAYMADNNGDWAWIVWGEKEGYVPSTYINIVDDALLPYGGDVIEIDDNLIEQLQELNKNNGKIIIGSGSRLLPPIVDKTTGGDVPNLKLPPTKVKPEIKETTIESSTKEQDKKTTDSISTSVNKIPSPTLKPIESTIVSSKPVSKETIISPKPVVVTPNSSNSIKPTTSNDNVTSNGKGISELQRKFQEKKNKTQSQILPVSVTNETTSTNTNSTTKITPVSPVKVISTTTLPVPVIKPIIEVVPETTTPHSNIEKIEEDENKHEEEEENRLTYVSRSSILSAESQGFIIPNELKEKLVAPPIKVTPHKPSPSVKPPVVPKGPDTPAPVLPQTTNEEENKSSSTIIPVPPTSERKTDSIDNLVDAYVDGLYSEFDNTIIEHKNDDSLINDATIKDNKETIQIIPPFETTLSPIHSPVTTSIANPPPPPRGLSLGFSNDNLIDKDQLDIIKNNKLVSPEITTNNKNSFTFDEMKTGQHVHAKSSVKITRNDLIIPGFRGESKSNRKQRVSTSITSSPSIIGTEGIIATSEDATEFEIEVPPEVRRQENNQREDRKKWIESVFHVFNIKTKPPTTPRQKVTLARVLYPYTAVGKTELNLYKGDIIEMLPGGKNGWAQGRNNFGKTGFFPSTYVQILKLKEITTKDIAFIKEGGIYCKVLRSYKAQDKGQLSIERGQRIRITEEEVNGWLKGVTTDGSQSGWFPACYCEKD
ncbi:hypothetical protein WA158_001107 [Blastocystis sp. Blastoise]